MKDILLIMSDQHGQAYMQMEDGRIRTPHMMRIAKEGISFSNCYCNAPLCVPSRMSFLSGKMPGTLQIFNNDTTLPIDMPTIAHAMGACGYRTVLAGRMHFKGDDQNHGFDERLAGEITSQYWGTGGKQRTDFGDYAGTTNRKHCLEAVGGGDSPVMAYDRQVFQAAMDLLKEDHEQPLFLVVGFYGPHFPFVCEPSLYEYYKGILGKEELDTLDSEEEYREYRQTFSPEKARNCKAAYYGLVEMLDHYVGALYDRFREKNRDSLFFYLSDHGEQLGKHGIFGKQTLYQDSIRVPLLIAGTEVTTGVRREQVSLLDVSKTILEQAGAVSQWHDGTAISLCEEERHRPPVVIQQMLTVKGESVLAEAVVRVPYKAVKIGKAIRVYRLGEQGQEERQDPQECREFLTEALSCFTKEETAAQLQNKEKQLKQQHDLLKQWGKAKRPPESACMPIPECARRMPIE